MFLQKLILLWLMENLSYLLETTTLNYFVKRERSLLQSVISQNDLKLSNIDTATRMTNSSSTLIDYSITEGYETRIVAIAILKPDHFAKITVFKSVMLK